MRWPIRKSSSLPPNILLPVRGKKKKKKKSQRNLNLHFSSRLCSLTDCNFNDCPKTSAARGQKKKKGHFIYFPAALVSFLTFQLRCKVNTCCFQSCEDVHITGQFLIHPLGGWWCQPRLWTNSVAWQRRVEDLQSCNRTIEVFVRSGPCCVSITVHLLITPSNPKTWPSIVGYSSHDLNIELRGGTINPRS